MISTESKKMRIIFINRNAPLWKINEEGTNNGVTLKIEDSLSMMRDYEKYINTPPELCTLNILVVMLILI